MLARGNVRCFSIALVIALLWAVVNYHVMRTLWVHGFDDGTYSHAYLVPFIIVYLLYTCAQTGKFELRTSVNRYWLILGCLVGVIYIVALFSQISLLYWFFSLALLIVLVFQVFKFSWFLIFPLVYLILIYPFWGAFAPFFQDLSVFVVTLIMSFTEIPVFVENEFVTIPAGVFEIARGCSGLRYIIVSLAISSLYVYLYLRTVKSALIFVIVALFGALVTNWVRIVCLILIGHYTNMESSLMTDHNNFGWYIYIPVVLVQFYIGARLERSEEILGLHNQKVVKMKPAESVSINKSALMSAMVLLLSASSVSVNLYTTAYTKNHHAAESGCELAVTDNIFTVYNFDFVCELVSDKAEQRQFKFLYSGKLLDGKASYYLNTVIPETHRLLSERNDNEYKTLLTKNNVGQTWLLKYNYEMDGATYSSPKLFKFARLKNALKGKTEHWLNISIEKCDFACVKSFSRQQGD